MMPSFPLPDLEKKSKQKGVNAYLHLSKAPSNQPTVAMPKFEVDARKETLL